MLAGQKDELILGLESYFREHDGGLHSSSRVIIE